MRLEDISEEDIRDIADSSTILARGLDYYERGQIASMSIEGEKIRARVNGSYGTYNVEIAIEDGTLQADCDCPYDGYGCKHIVAVLYKWISGSKYIDVKKSRKGKLDIEKELGKLSKDTLVSILVDLINNYEDSKRDVVLRLSGNPDAIDAGKEIIISQIRDAFYTRDDFIDYRAVFGVVKKLEEIKDKTLTLPPDARSSLLRFLAKGSYDAIEYTDDSSGELGGFIVDCLTDLGKSIHEQKLSFEDNKKLIMENLELLDNEEYGLEEGYTNLVIEIPSTEQGYAFLIDELKSRMEKKKESYEWEMYREMLTEAYRRAGNEKEYLAMLEEDASEEGDHLPLVLFWKEKGEIKKAISIAEETIKNKSMADFDKIELLVFLEEIYRTNRDYEDLLRISTIYFKDHPTLKKYMEIKGISEELGSWDSVKPMLLESAEGTELVKIYLFEKEHDKAYRMVMSKNERYSDRLRNKVALALMKEHPEKALKIYLPIVQEFIDGAKRDSYRVAALYAKRVKEIYSAQGKEEGWNRYIEGIRRVNKRRPALIDEFGRL